jgi:type II secretory pathway component PulF
MKFFSVTFLSNHEKKTELIEAISRENAKMIILKQHQKAQILSVKNAPIPIEYKLQNIKLELFKFLGIKNSKNENIIAFLEQLHVMISAGISLLNSLRELELTTKDIFIRQVIRSIIINLDNGENFSTSIKPFEKEFGALTVSMIELGDKTGNYSNSLNQLIIMLKEIETNREKFKKAMAYPRNIFIAMIFAFIAIVSFVLPKFSVIFDRFGNDLPLPTKILLGLEHLFANYGIQIFLILILSFVIFRVTHQRSKNFKAQIDSLLLKISLIKNIILYSTLYRFNLVLLELIRSGVPIYEALQITLEMVENSVLKEKLNNIYTNIHKGNSLTEGFRRSELFENMISQMIFIGENSGKLESMLKSITDFYKKRFDSIIENISSSIEPLILFVIATFVLIFALGVFMPIWDLGNVMLK